MAVPTRHLLLQFLCPQVVVAREGDTHVDRSDDVQRVLEDEEADSTDIDALTAVVGAVRLTVITVERRSIIEHPVRTENEYDEIDDKHNVEEDLQRTDAAAASCGFPRPAPVVVFADGGDGRDSTKQESDAQ